MHGLHLYVHTFQSLLHCADLTQSQPGHVVILTTRARQTILDIKYTNLVRLKLTAKLQIIS